MLLRSLPGGELLRALLERVSVSSQSRGQNAWGAGTWARQRVCCADSQGPHESR